ncbi:MAG: hypothetical protein LLF92_08990 [Planctomycetaceae bacterium]|nr:hypothetical protein [Planctomycetaceae bacterium]
MEKKKIKLKTRVIVSIILGTIGLVIGFCASWSEPNGDTPQKIKDTEIAIEKLCADIGKKSQDIKGNPEWMKDDILVAFSWKDLEKITNSLIYQNEKIAKAKALIRCESNPIPQYAFDDYLWNIRFEVSNEKWQIQTTSSRIFLGIGIAILSCFGTIVGTFLTLTIIPWLWYLLLGRISELSQAIQGK